MQPVQLTGKRDHYIDNLRSISILLLFPVHTFMIWNNFGSGFYVWLEENKIYSTLIVLINPWFMPLLFLLAGISARLSLEKRTTKEFVIQRINKLLIPFITGMVFLVPIQTLYARKFFYNYSGGFIENWRYFFTHFTDLSGYDGAFTPGHLWFILYLFIISILSLIIFRYLPYKKVVQVTGKLHISWCCLVIYIMYFNCFLFISVKCHIIEIISKPVAQCTFFPCNWYNYIIICLAVNSLVCHNKKRIPVIP